MELFSEKTEAGKRPIIVNMAIPTHRVWELLIGAFESSSGSHYWARVIKYTYGKGFKEEDFAYIHEIPFAPGCSITIEDGNEPGKESWVLDHAALERGLKAMNEKHIKHYADFITGEYDAITSDVYLQCCLFGEIRFG